MDKRGVLGLNLVKLVFIAILVLGVLAVAIPLALVSLRDTTDLLAKNTVFLVNSTLTTVDENGEFITGTQYLRNCVLTITSVNNATDGIAITSDKYTNSACKVSAVAAGTFNNTNWNVIGQYEYAIQAPTAILGNVTTAQTGFLSNTTTIYAILIVVVIILAIAIIVIVVTKFGGGRGEGFGGGKISGGSVSFRRGARGSGTVMGV